MSINVTVHGNPISIKKGKMVTSDAESEFQRRRLIRLQQVRQQSKEIAADVRNRVRKEKERIITKTEQKGEQDLKRWKQRKLLALQHQYEECLKDVGAAHATAAAEVDPDTILHERAVKNKAEANLRGKKAHEKLTQEDKEKRKESEKLQQMRKKTRKTENERSEMVATLNRSRKKKKKKWKKTGSPQVISSVYLDNTYLSDAENISGNITTDKVERIQKPNISIEVSSPENVSIEKILDTSAYDSSPSILNDSVESQNRNISILCPNPVKQTEVSHPSKKSIDGIMKTSKQYENVQKIKSFEIPSDSEQFDVSSPPRRAKCGCLLEQSKYSRRSNDMSPDFDDCFVMSQVRTSNIPKNKPCKCVFNIESYKICDIQGKETCAESPCLPYVPATTVQPESETLPSKSKVKYYDRINHFGKEYTAKPVVQRITKESIKVNPTTEKAETEEALKLMQSRDRIAHDRGVKAMEKEKIQKDYKQLMEELPVLQRQEQMAQMRSHNPSFHMNEQRLEELEKRRQVKIENIFEKYYNKTKVLKTPLVTIRPIQKSPPADEMKLPFRALDVTESPVQLNVAEWTNEYSESDHQIQENIQNKQKALVDLLQRVNKQRELLLKEVSTLPASSNLQQILQDDEILKLCLCDEGKEKKSKHSRKAKIKNMVSTGTSPVLVKSSSKTKHHRSVSPSSGNSSSETVTHKKHKKYKLKHKENKILIKSEGTQTSPSIPNVKSSSPRITESEETDKIDIAKNKRSSDKTAAIKKCSTCCNICTCTTKDPSEKLCEIVIQMSNKSDLKICKSEEESTGKKVVLNVSKPTKISIRSPQNVNDKSSGITYRNLPEYQQKSTQQKQTSQQKVCPLDVPQPAARTSRQQYKDMLHDKPQQTNIDNKCKQIPESQPCYKKEITPNLLRYIQKLLCMSRQSIDELTISSISESSTPGTSIIDNSENNTLAQLQNVMQHYNLSFNDIQKHLSVSESSKSSIEVHTTPLKSQAKQKQESSNLTSDVTDETEEFQKRYSREKPTDEKSSPKTSSKIIFSTRDTADKKRASLLISSPQKPEKIQSRQSSSASSPDSNKDSVDASDIPYDSILSKYKELTETCCDRISKLTEMIDNVRLEKERLLSPENSDKYETSVTSYLELPKTFDSTRVESNGNKTACNCNSSSTNSSSLSQDAIDRYLLAIDKSTCNEPSTNVQNQCCEENNEIDEIPVSDNPNHINTNQEQFVPMLQGIPKYFESSENQAMNLINSPVKQFLLNSKSKPPPALLNVNRHNLDINMTPHELSTIVELDTIISSRNVSEIAVIKPYTPEKKIRITDEVENQENTITEKEASGFVTLTPEYFKTSPKEQNKTCDCKPESPKKSSIKKDHSRSSSQERSASHRVDVSGVGPLPSELSTSSPEDMEHILRNMGLGWAVSTLKKTQEALALSSSSSSVETSFRKRVSFKHTNSSSSSSTSTNNSDVSLKNVLSKELMRKISSSTLISNSSGMSPNLQELGDISEIRNQTVLNRDGSQQRTSTPVQNSKSTDSKKELFTGDSDISSVRLQSEEFFLSLPNMSLSSTNKSLSKSKQ